MYLLTRPDSQPKGKKGIAFGYATALMHLAPAHEAGRGNVCAWSSPECRAICLHFAGRSGVLKAGATTNTIREARIRRTQLFFALGAKDFEAWLRLEIAEHRAWSAKRGLAPALRLNATSDIPWERVTPTLFSAFEDIRFYDYTKAPLTARPPEALPSNYHLTMSFSGHNREDCERALVQGRNVAVVFRTKRAAALPATCWGYPVIDGDQHDLRFLDPAGVIVGLRVKGRTTAVRERESAFVLAPEAAA